MIVCVVLVSTGLAQTPTQNTLPLVYQKWLGEDVAYIITTEERAKFLALTNDRNRDSFIAQFWEKRNPNPGNSENTYKEEHYRRIAYTNEHFAAGVPGWKTDRGRVYIVSGPPYGIKRAYSSLHPAEIWRYKSGKQFRFVDDCDCGQYRVQPARPLQPVQPAQPQQLQWKWLPKM